MTINTNSQEEITALNKLGSRSAFILLGGVLLAGIGHFLGFTEVVKRTMWYLSPNANNAIALQADSEEGIAGNFPPVSGFNLLGDQFHLPGDFTDSYNIVLLVYTQNQQNDVYPWIPLLEQLSTDLPDVNYYELPTLPEFNAAARAQLDQWMIAGIPDEATRNRTITLYLDVASFNQAVDVDDTNVIQIMIVTPNGEILWREEGAFSEAKGEALRARIRELVN